MIETLTNLKNNKLKRTAGQQHRGGEAVERMKKFLSGLNKKRHGASTLPPLRCDIPPDSFYVSAEQSSHVSHCVYLWRICTLPRVKENGGSLVQHGVAIHFSIGRRLAKLMRRLDAR